MHQIVHYNPSSYILLPMGRRLHSVHRVPRVTVITDALTISRSTIGIKIQFAKAEEKMSVPVQWPRLPENAAAMRPLPEHQTLAETRQPQ